MGLLSFSVSFFFLSKKKKNTGTNCFSTDVCYLEKTIPVAFGMWLMAVGVWLRVLGAVGASWCGSGPAMGYQWWLGMWNVVWELTLTVPAQDGMP